MRIVILGPYLSGIGTQAVILSQTLRVPQISPGEMLRSAVRDKTPAGQAAVRELRNGDLIGDETVLAMVIERLAQRDADNGFILHGFPETIRQAVVLDETLRQRHRHLDAIIEISKSFQTQERQTEGTEYLAPPVNIAPVANYYWNQQRLLVIDGLRDLGTISEEILKELELQDIV
ncbi:adenylate kinase family protein [Rhizobium ruizarguesonis]